MSEQASSSIYDLGYRHYDGNRIGRRGTLLTLYVHASGVAFGLGRRATSKIFPFALAIFAFVPAIIQLGVGAITSGVDQHVDLFKHEDYFTYVRIILVLFCAAVAPELVGRDQRNRTLSLYFSRAVSRLRLRDREVRRAGERDARAHARAAGCCSSSATGWPTTTSPATSPTTWDLILPIVAGSLLISAVIAAVGLCIAAYLPRRAYSTAAIVGVFVLTLAAAHIVMETADATYARFGLLLSPVAWEGAILWLFGVDPDPPERPRRRDLGGWVYLLAVLIAAIAAPRAHRAALRAGDGMTVSHASGRRGAAAVAETGATIVLRDVSRWYGNVVAVNGMSFTVSPGITGLLGPNGAGKSTLLHMLAGLPQAVGRRGRPCSASRRGATRRSTGASASCPSGSRSTARSPVTSSSA